MNTGVAFISIKLDTSGVNEKMDEVIKKIGEVANKLECISENLEGAFNNSAVGEISVITGFLGGLAAVGINIPKIFMDIGAALGPTGIAIAAAVVVIAGAFTLLYTKCEGFANGVNKVFELMMIPFTHFWEQNGSSVMTSFGMLFSSIGDFFEQVVVLFQGFWNLVSPIFITGWAVMSAIVSEFMTGIWQYIKTSLGMVTSIFAAFTLLLTGDWDGLWSHLKKSLGTFDAFLVNCFNVLFGSIPGIADNGFIMLVDAVMDNMEGIKELFSTSLNEVPDKMKEIGGNIIDGVRKGITGKMGNILESIQEIIGMIVGVFRNDLEIHSPSRVMMEIGKFIILGLVNGLKSSVQWVLGFIGQFVTNVIAWMTTNIPLIITAVGAFFATLWTSITTFFTNLWLGITTFFTNVWLSITMFFTNLPVMVGTWLMMVITKLTEFATSAILWVNTNVVTIINSIVGFFAGLPEKVKEKASEVLTKLGEWVTEAVAWAGENIPTFIEEIMTFFNELPDKVLTAGNELVAGLWEGINEKKDWIVEKIGGFTNNRSKFLVVEI